MTAWSLLPRRNRLASFTLIELLTVIFIISILAALLLSAGSGVMKKAARSRASSEIQAMSTALEGYKTDNGIYPPTGTLALLTNTPYSSTDGSVSAGVYQQSSQILYMALSGQTNFLDTHAAGVKAYMSFKINQLGNITTAAGTAPSAGSSTYVKDPWNYSYGYSTGDANNPQVNSPYNGSGFFDLWSTGGVTQAQESANNTLTNAWLSNWQ